MRALLVALVLLPLAAAAKPLKLSVLYFDNNTGKAELEPLKKGLADMLTTDLAQLPGVTVVEREKLQAVLDEQQLSRSKFFDPKTAVQAGKLVGATHVVTGAMAALEPQVRLDIRLVDVANGNVIVTGQVVGNGADIFELEQQLVRRFAGGLAVKEKGLVTGRASVAALLSYSQGLDAQDRGDLEAARTTMTSALAAAPGFELARKRYAELLARLEAAATVRGAALSDDERALVQHIDEWTRVPLASAPPGQAKFVVGYLDARYQLAVARLARLVGPTQAGLPVVVPPSQRASLARLEQDALAAAAKLVAELRTVPSAPSGAVFPDDEKRLAALLERDVSFTWLNRPGMVASQAAHLALLGEARDAKLLYRPTLAQRDASVIDAHLAGLDAEVAESTEGVADLVGWNACDAGAEGLVLAGRKDQAIARWQKFLDAHPRSAHFQEGRARIEELLLVSPDVAGALAALDKCQPDTQVKFMLLFRAVGRAEGRAGLERILKKIEACAPKQGQLAMGWRVNGYDISTAQALQLGDCDWFKAMRAKTAKLGPVYGSTFVRYKTRCDEK